MKRADIKKCTLCGKGVMHAGVPLFWRVKIERFGVDAGAVQRRAGMEMHFGGGIMGAALAGIMGPDEDLAKPVMDPVEIVVCEECGIGKRSCIAALAENEVENDEKRTD